MRARLSALGDVRRQAGEDGREGSSERERANKSPAARAAEQENRFGDLGGRKIMNWAARSRAPTIWAVAQKDLNLRQIVMKTAKFGRHRKKVWRENGRFV